MPPATFPTGWLDGYCFSSALSFLYLHINLGAYTQLTFFFFSKQSRSCYRNENQLLSFPK